MARPRVDPFPGDTESAVLMRSVDWAATPIGAPEDWPQSLKTSLSICLASRFPIILLWGPHHVMLYNDAYAQIIAAKHPAAMGMDVANCFPEVWDIIEPMLRGVLDGGPSTWSQDQLLFLERNGFIEECYFTFSYSPIHDETGGVGGVFTVVTETTGRVLGERRLALLRRLAMDASDAGHAIDAANEALQVLAQAPEDVPFALLYRQDGDAWPLVASVGLGRNAVGIATAAPANMSWTNLPAIITDLHELLDVVPADPWGDRPKRAVAISLERAGAERSWGVLVVGLAPRLAFDREYESFCRLTANSIAMAMTNANAFESERRRSEALAEIDRAKTIFFTNVSHEFRTPLTLLLGALDEVGKGGPLPEPELEQLELAQRNAGRLLRLVNALLEFSRIEAGRIEAIYEPIDLGRLTAQLANMFASAFETAGVDLVIEVEPDLEPVYVDRDMWERVVLNLVSNAFKNTHHGVVTIGLAMDEEAAILTVADTGIGIDPVEIPRLFERFHRVENPGARSFEGLGIGLALVSGLVSLHGGTIDVVSQLAEGSRFTVRIPLGREHLPADRVRVEPSTLGASGLARGFVSEVLGWLPARPDPAGHAATPSDETDRARVLVVDDNADMRRYITHILQEDYEVATAIDGVSALDQISIDRPDLILADVMMPRLDGFALVSRVRADPATMAIPIVLLSARAGEEATIEGRKTGADDYVVKPFTAADLRARIAAHIATARLREAATQELRESLAHLQENDEALRRALAAKDDFLSMVSHEIRTPLTTIIGNARVLARSASRLDAEARADAVVDIAAEGERLNRVIDNLLVLARMDIGDRLVLEPLIIGRFVRRTVETYAASHPGRQFHLHGCDDPIPLDAHADSLEQVLINLLSNAVKYSPDTAPIDIGCRREPEHLTVWVGDRGVGLDRSEIEALFEPFYRSPRTRRQAGLGIGLTVGRRLMDAQGGTLSAEPRDGSGAVFSLRLPQAADIDDATADL